MPKTLFLVTVMLMSSLLNAQQNPVSLDQWHVRMKKAEPFPHINVDILKHAAFGEDELNWFSLRETPAVRYGLTINDSVDERRHPYLASIAFERMKIDASCEVKIIDVNIPEKYQDALTNKLNEDHWIPVKTRGPVSIDDIAKHSNATNLSWKRANLHLLHLYVPSQETHLFVPSYERNQIDSIIEMIKESKKEEESPKPDNIYEITVKSGESLSVIAIREGVRVNEIIRWNKLPSDRIYAGQKLLIFEAEPKEKKKVQKTPITPSSTESIKHVVTSGESLWSIANQYPGISPDDIKAYNNLRGDRIDIDQVLFIPNVPSDE